jgi:hypothetical protein
MRIVAVRSSCSDRRRHAGEYGALPAPGEISPPACAAMPASESRQTLIRPVFRIFEPGQPCRRPDLIIGMDVRNAARDGSRARFECASTQLAQVASSGVKAV